MQLGGMPETDAEPLRLMFSGWQHGRWAQKGKIENKTQIIIAFRATFTADCEPNIEVTESDTEVPCQYN